MNRTKRLVIGAAVAAWGFNVSSAAAATTWNGSAGMGTAWSVADNWTDGLPAGSDVLFNDTGAAADAATITNVADADVTALTLRYANVNPAFHHTQIPAGVTLSLTGGGSMLYVGTGTDLGSAATVQANVSGGGTLALNNTAGDMIIRQTSATTGGSKRATLDMTGLNAFNANIRNLQVGVGTSNTGGMGRATGTLLLADNNQVTANSILVASNPPSGGGLQSRIYLGQSNTIHTNSITIAASLGNGRLDYRNGISGGTLVLRGADGVGRADLHIGVQPLTGGPNGTTTGVMDLTSGASTGGGSIDAKVDELLLGRSGNSLSYGGNGTLTFNSGIINANTVILGQQAPEAGGSNPTSRGTGTLNALGGSLVVNGNVTLGMVKADFTNSSTAGGTGNLNISNGAVVRVAGAVVDGTLASSVATGISNIAVNTGGILQARSLGSADAPIDSLSLNGATLGVDLGADGAGAGAWGRAIALTADGANVIELKTSGGLSAGPITALQFDSLAGAGFSTFSLAKLPARVQASLVDGTNGAGAGTIGINVISADQPRWDGNVAGGVWDIASTENWKLLNAGTSTTYQEDLVTYATTDSVLFNDDAAGTKTVDVSTTVAPNGILIDTAGGYTFAGSGKITGSGGLIKRGTGAATLSNTGGNDFTGAVRIEGGTLAAAANAVLPAGAIVTITGSSTLDVGSTTHTVQQINVEGGTLAGAGGTISATELRATGGTISANIGSVNVFDYSGPAALALSGNSTFDAVLEIPTGGTVLVTSDNALGSTVGHTGLTGGAQTGTLQLSGGVTVPENIWMRGRQTNVNFTPHIENVSGNNTLTGQISMPTGGGWYNLESTAGKLTIAGDIVNNNTSVRNLFLRGNGDGEISGGYVDTNTGAGNLVKEGTGTWTLSGHSSYTGTTTVSDGQLVLAQDFVSPSGLTVANGARLTVAPSGSRVVGFSAIDVQSTGKVDLTDNKLITPMAVGTWTGSAYDGVAGMVDSARGNAGTPLWDGPSGITTSDARAQGSNLVSIGVAKAGDVKGITDTDTATFAGQTVLGSDTIAMVTYGGDATMDGKINIDDYGRIDANVAQSGSVFGWYNGDFNYDGAINIDDYGIIDGNIANQGTAFPTAAVAAGAQAVSAVPEPASLSVLALGAVALIRRRRGA